MRFVSLTCSTQVIEAGDERGAVLTPCVRHEASEVMQAKGGDWLVVVVYKIRASAPHLHRVTPGKYGCCSRRVNRSGTSIVHDATVHVELREKGLTAETTPTATNERIAIEALSLCCPLQGDSSDALKLALQVETLSSSDKKAVSRASVESLYRTVSEWATRTSMSEPLPNGCVVERLRPIVVVVRPAGRSDGSAPQSSQEPPLTNAASIDTLREMLENVQRAIADAEGDRAEMKALLLRYDQRVLAVRHGGADAEAAKSMRVTGRGEVVATPPRKRRGVPLTILVCLTTLTFAIAFAYRPIEYELT
jgi:hypothetical protein